MADVRTDQSDAARGSIVVVGSANLDYLINLTSPPAPGETVLASGMVVQPGGKGADQAVAAARLGAHVTFVGCVGQDADGDALLDSLRAAGVDVSPVRRVPERTGLALVSVFDSGENSITVVPGANFALTPEDVRDAIAQASAAGATVMIAQAEIAPETLAAALIAAHDAGLRVILNLAPFTVLDDALLALCDPLVVNESEATRSLSLSEGSLSSSKGSLSSSKGSLSSSKGSLSSSKGPAEPRSLSSSKGPSTSTTLARDLSTLARSAVITLGPGGAAWGPPDGGGGGPPPPPPPHGGPHQNEAGHAPPPPPPAVAAPTGAGDAFVGALAVELAAGTPLEDAVRLGVRAGTFAVQSLGAQSSDPTPADL